MDLCTCTICNRPDRAEIESVLMDCGPELSVEDVANHYQLSVDELKTHMLFHTPIDVATGKGLAEGDSMVKRIKRKEAEILDAVAKEYLITLRNLGRKINGDINRQSDTDSGDLLYISKTLTKPVVDLYLGTGNQIQQVVKSLAEIDRMVNGSDTDSTAHGLVDLANAIRGS